MTARLYILTPEGSAARWRRRADEVHRCAVAAKVAGDEAAYSAGIADMKTCDRNALWARSHEERRQRNREQARVLETALEEMEGVS